jgi:hypothetical protein
MMPDGKCMRRLDRDYRRRSPVATSSSPEQSNPPAVETNRIVAKLEATHGRSLDWNGTERNGKKVKSPRREREFEGSDGREILHQSQTLEDKMQKIFRKIYRISGKLHYLHGLMKVLITRF